MSPDRRHVSVGELKDKMQLIEERQHSEHIKTRAVIVAVSLPSVLKTLVLLGVVSPPHLPF